jgi:hypothetical protein
MQSTRATATPSRGKEQIRGQSNRASEASVFWFPVYEGIFEHASIMGDAVWLFMWLIARTTDDGDGKGKVLGRVPINDARPAGELGCSVKTVRRWRRTLVHGGYIATVRTPYGFKYTLLKSKKWRKQALRELPKLPISSRECAQNGHTDLPLRAVRVPVPGTEIAQNGKYKEDNTETLQKQHKEEALEEAAAVDLKEKNQPQKIHQAWSDLQMEPCGTPRFCRKWEEAWEAGEVGDKMVDLMERAIQSCQAQRVSVPPPFYRAKRTMEGNSEQDNPDNMHVGAREIPAEYQR